MNKGHKIVQKKKNHIQALSNPLEARCRRVLSAKQDYNLNPSDLARGHSLSFWHESRYLLMRITLKMTSQS